MTFQCLLYFSLLTVLLVVFDSQFDEVNKGQRDFVKVLLIIKQWGLHQSSAKLIVYRNWYSPNWN